MKRFTETGKWFDAWFERLPTEYRLAWLYVLDQCNMAGVIDASVRHMCYCVGTSFTAQQFLDNMEGRVVPVGRDKWIIPKFIPFQYGKTLKRTSKVHMSVLKRLYDDGVNFEIIVDNQLFSDASSALGMPRAYPSPRLGATPKDKAKDKDTDKEMDKDKDMAKDNAKAKDMEKEDALGF